MYKIDILNEKLKPFLKSIDKLPSESELRILKRFDIIYLIEKNGGYINTAKILNVERTHRTINTLDNDKVLSQYELIFDNFLFLNDIKHEVGNRILETNRRYDFKFKNLNNQDIYVEIWGLDTDKYKRNRIIKEDIYKNNNLILLSVEKNVFHQEKIDMIKELENLMINNNIKLSNFSKKYDLIFNGKLYNKTIVINEIKDIIKTIGRFPTNKDLKELGLLYLEKHICKYGGYRKLKKELNFKQYYKDWSDIKEIKKEILPLCKKYNRLPTEKELLDLNRSDILSCYRKYGIIKITEILGYKSFKCINKIKKAGYWKNENNFLKELNKFIDDLGHIPRNKDFINHKRKDILNAINRHYGGMKNLHHYI